MPTLCEDKNRRLRAACIKPEKTIIHAHYAAIVSAKYIWNKHRPVELDQPSEASNCKDCIINSSIQRIWQVTTILQSIISIDQSSEAYISSSV